MYVFSVDHEGNKVVHGNYVPTTSKTKGLDARNWASMVSTILGGRAGGKDDSAQGVGTAINKVEEALKVARDYYMTSG